MNQVGNVGVLSKLAISLYRPSGLIGPSKSYQRYIIFGQQRTGSTMLLSALRSHPYAWCYSELFNGRVPMFRTDGLSDTSKFLDLYRRINPIDFLESFVFRGYRQDIQAVGFKIFPEHLERVWFRRIWDWLEKNDDLKLIHIKRCNKLEVYLSLVRAQVSGSWSVDWPAARKEVPPVRLDPDECVKAFESGEKADRFLEERLPRANLLSVVYEDICGDQLVYLQKLQEHLGLTPKPIAPGILKQRTRSLKESIANYEELHSAFRRTKWEHFFEDN